MNKAELAIRALAAGVLGALLCMMAFLPMTAVAGTDEGHWESLGEYKLTAYCNCKHCCGRWSGGPCASGVMPEAGRTAAGSLPFGTHLLIDGEEYILEDRGVSGKHIDIYMDSHDAALDFGVKHQEIFRWVPDDETT